MKITSQRKDGKLLISLKGDIDHHSAKVAIPEISRLIDRELPQSLILDFNDVTFMDSSGLAVVIGAFKRANSIDCSFLIINTPKQAYKVFDAAGICRLISIKEPEKILT